MKKEWATAISDKTKRQGNLLRKIRESSGLTMRQLAMQVGISHPAISQLEHGKLELPRYRVEQIVTACGHSMTDFDKMLGKGFVSPNYREECISIIKALDDDTIRLFYQLLAKIGTNVSVSKKRLEAL
jgi:transcriptional regulator with XRE-family HTH domain